MIDRAYGAFGVCVLAVLVPGACAATRDPTRPPIDAPVLATAGACVSCHAAIVEEWRGSFHRVSFTDATFQASLALEEPVDRAFCVRCHAPAGERAAGVDCASCHGASPHEARRAGVAMCAPCHEFGFDARPELVQKTVSEHAASDFATVACTSCHMPNRSGHKDHRFVSGHAPERMKGAIHVEAQRRNDAIRFVIRVDAGHAFPTGDMFRRARLLVFADADDGHVVASAERTFGRTWTSLRDGRRTQASDTRIRNTWSDDVSLGEPSAPIARVRWSLVYDRVVVMRPPHVGLASSDVVSDGEVTW